MKQDDVNHPVDREEEEATECMDAPSQSMEEGECRDCEDHVSDRCSQGGEEDVSTCELSGEISPLVDKLDHSLLDTSNLDSYTRNLEKVKRKFASFFLDDEQLELFCLLPLSNKQRVELLGQINQQ